MGNGVSAIFDLISEVLMGIPQQALLKAYDEQNSSEVLPPTRKSKHRALLRLSQPAFSRPLELAPSNYLIVIFSL